MLFCHITTQVEGDPHPNLLSEKGGMGFPHMVVLDADGMVLAMHEGGRSTDAFAETVEQAKQTQKELAELTAAAAKGDEAAARNLFEKQLELNHLKPAAALERLGKLKGIDDEQKARFLGLIAEAEVAEQLGKLTDDEATHAAAGKVFVAMMEAGRVPPEGQNQLYFWYLMSIHAQQENKLDVMTKAVEGLRAMSRKPERLMKDLEAKLEKMKGDGGDKGK